MNDRDKELAIIREYKRLLREMDKESLGSADSTKRYHEKFGAYRALKWALGIARIRPTDYINKPRESYRKEYGDVETRGIAPRMERKRLNVRRRTSPEVQG